MLQVASPANTRTITLCDLNGPVGICRLIDNQFVVVADDTTRQEELSQRVRAQYRLLARFAREDGQKLTKEDFFMDMPHYVRGLTFYATRPLPSFEELLPEGLKQRYVMTFQNSKTNKK